MKFTPSISVFLILFFIILNNAYSQDSTSIPGVNWKLIGPGDADQITSLSIMENGVIFAGTDIGGLYKSTNNGDSWAPFNTGLNNLDITTKVIQSQEDKNVLLVGTRGGLYKSSDFGKTWDRLENGLPQAKDYSLSGSIGGIAIDKKDNKTIYAAIGYRPSYDGTATVRKTKGSEVIYKSTDTGNSWLPLKAFPNDTKTSQLLISHWDRTTIFASTNKGLFVSENSGLKWKNILKQPIFNILLDKDNKNIIYAAAGENGILRSTDYGSTWNEYNNGLSLFDFLGRFKNRYSVLASDPGNKNIFYLINSTWGRSGGLYKSNNKGRSWNLITGNMPESWLKTSRRMNDVAISESNSDLLFLGSSRYLYSSSNGGKSWQQKISNRIDNGWSHTGINVFGQTRTIKVDTEDTNILYIATADHKILRSRNNGVSWDLLLGDDKQVHNVWDIDICPSDDYRIHIVTSNLKNRLCTLNSTDKGENWNKICSNLGKTSRREKIRVSPHDCNIVILATHNGIFRSTNNGTTWKHISVNNYSTTVRSITFDINKTNLVYAGTDKGLFKSTDNGNSWSLINNTANMTITSIHILPGNSSTIYIGTQLSKKGHGAIYKSTDQGASWTKTLGNIRRYVSAITSLPAQSNQIYAATLDDNYHDLSKGRGIYKSIDNGDTWHRVDSNLPVFRAYDITTSPLRPGDVFLATNGSGAYIANEKKILETGK